MKKTNSETDLLVVQEDNEAVVTIIDDSEDVVINSQELTEQQIEDVKYGRKNQNL